jgi:hypothetical protein
MEHQQFLAYLCYHTTESAYLRVKQLIDTGRPIIMIERNMDGGEMRVSTGLSIEEGGFRPGVHFRKNPDFAEFSVVTTGIGLFGYGDVPQSGNESEAARRFHNKLDGARIQVEGFGQGRNDHAVIQRWSENGNGRETALYLQYDDHPHRVQREAAFLDVLAERDWTADDIRKLAEKMRKWREPFAENLNFYMEEMNR